MGLLNPRSEVFSLQHRGRVQRKISWSTRCRLKFAAVILKCHCAKESARNLLKVLTSRLWFNMSKITTRNPDFLPASQFNVLQVDFHLRPYTSHQAGPPVRHLVRLSFWNLLLLFPALEGENDTSPSGRRRRPGASSFERSALGFRSLRRLGLSNQLPLYIAEIYSPWYLRLQDFRSQEEAPCHHF